MQHTVNHVNEPISFVQRSSHLINNGAKGNWKKIRIWWKKRSDDRLIKANNKREHSIGILQKRYGYTKEKATSELDEHYPKARLF
jgi:uncharacterized protein YjbJ (UPF0337 family)